MTHPARRMIELNRDYPHQILIKKFRERHEQGEFATLTLPAQMLIVGGKCWWRDKRRGHLVFGFWKPEALQQFIDQHNLHGEVK